MAFHCSQISSKTLPDPSKAPVIWPQSTSWLHHMPLSTAFIIFQSQQTAFISCLPWGSHHLPSWNTLPVMPVPFPDLRLANSYSFFKSWLICHFFREVVYDFSICISSLWRPGLFHANNKKPVLTDLVK